MSDYPTVPQEISQPISENLQKLAELFPAAVKDGALDVEALQEELGDFAEIQPGDEKYELNWIGKQAAKKKAFEPLLGKTLALKDDGKNTDTTENLYIEGDNLEALKLLRQNYYGEVKMIYIDPPYNTGNDFVYNDKFKIREDESNVEEGAVSEDGTRLVKNEKLSNRFHARWLDMMYPRLKVAKNLLDNDGAICVSINDDEEANLRRILDEVFGTENYVNTISVLAKVAAGASGGGEDKRLKKNIEYILVYAKSLQTLNPLTHLFTSRPLVDVIDEMRKDGESWKYTSILLPFAEDRVHFKSVKDGDGNAIEIYKRGGISRTTIARVIKEEDITEEEAYTKYFQSIFSDTNAQTSIRTRVIDAVGSLDEGECLEVEYVPRSGKDKGILVTHTYISNTVRRVIWLSDVADSEDGVIIKREKLGTFWEDFDYNNVGREGSVPFPDGKKPISLLSHCISIYKDTEGVFLDFFSGSGSFAHAIMEANKRDGGRRRHISIQLPEPIQTRNPRYSKAVEFYEENNIPLIVSEIGKERIRRAGDKIIEELQAERAKLEAKGKLEEESNPYILDPDSLDIGFKSFRIEDTKINWLKKDLRGEDLEAEAGLTTQDALDFVPGFTDQDIVYELMLRQSNIPLTHSISQPDNTGKRTYLYGDAYLVCLEESITKELVETLAALEPTPLKYFFRDSAFGKDIALKDETFRRLNAEIAKNFGDDAEAYTVEFI
ncbi:MAG: site-specific DNA-methyltransferase [Verrucomicrobiales bacterium]|nr:site-specific DNA-methyltransferase [Verrucomicrobiales bacterium]